MHLPTHPEDLLDKWNEFEGAFKSLTDWIMDEAQHFSNLCTNKKEYGVVEHLDACDVRRGGRGGEGERGEGQRRGRGGEGVGRGRREEGEGREGEGEYGGGQVGEDRESKVRR